METEILVAADAGLAIGSPADVATAVGATFDKEGLILTEGDLSPAFFDLRTGLAGELFQKFTNYGLRLAIVLPDGEVYGERFGELVYEHRRHALIRFFLSAEAASAWLQP